MRRAVVFAVLAGAAFGFDDRQLARDIATGKSAGALIERNYRLLPDEVSQAEIAAIGQKIVAQLADRQIPWVFKTVVGESAPPLNEPWAFPGGFVYVPTELVLRARSEAQLAGMLAHAVTHVADRHMAQASKKAGVSPNVMWSPGGMHSTVLARFWREFEFAADANAAKLMAGAGYSPDEFVDYLERGGADAERVAKLMKASAGALPVSATVPGFKFANLQADVRKFAIVDEMPKAPKLRLSGRR